MRRAARQVTLRRLLILIAVVALALYLFGPLWPLSVIMAGPLVAGWVGGVIGGRGKAWGLAGFATAYAAALIANHVYDSLHLAPDRVATLAPTLVWPWGAVHVLVCSVGL